MRAPFQVLVIPYYRNKENIKYCIFKRSDLKIWQGIAGGGEDNESPIECAKRETFEEAEISPTNRFIELDSKTSIPVEAISGFIWGKNILVIPEHSFGVEVKNKKIALKKEHTQSIWLNYKDALNKLKWDSNKTALWELNYRLTNAEIKKD